MNKSFYKKALSEMTSSMEGREVNRISIITNKGYYCFKATNCTGMLCSPHVNYPGLKGDGITVTAIASMLCRGCEEKEYARDFIDWLVNRSPYESVFISKNVDEIVADKCTTVEAKSPSNLMVGALIAARGLWEYTHIGRGWYELYKRGVNENLAFLLAHKANFSTDGNVSFCNNGGGHKSININSGVQGLRRFILNEPALLNEPYKDCLKYGNIDNTWIGSTTDMGTNALKNIVSGVKYNKQLTNNIFSGAIRHAVKSTSISDGFDQLAIIANDFMKTLGD
jgi:hypothetical protein